MLDVVSAHRHDEGTEVERATIEIETDGRIPRGALIAADGRRHVFAGWLEFGAALEDWRATVPSSATERKSS
jgi:hypothetical protein